MKKTATIGIAFIILGVLLWGIIPPAMIPGAIGGEESARWQHIAEDVSIASALVGIVAGFGLALVTVAFICRNRN